MSPHTLADWKCLPPEILYRILKVSESDQVVWTCTHVCKSWLLPAQTQLYSDVYLTYFEQLECFHRAIEQHPALGLMVKRLEFDTFEIVDSQERVILQKKTSVLLTSLLNTYLPNLESLGLDVLCSYISVLEALANSQLKSLKRLSLPLREMEKSEMALYKSCAISMKNHLEDLQLADDDESNYPSEERILFNRLRSQLHQFRKVHTIEIRNTTTRPAQLLDDVIENCPSLRCIEFHLTHNVRIPVVEEENEVSRYIPRNNIEKITTDATIILNLGLLSYIAHKLPSLPKLIIHPSTNGPIQLFPYRLEQLLTLLKKYKQFYVSGLRVDLDIFTRKLGDFWNATTVKPGTMHVRFFYTDHKSQGNFHLQNGELAINCSTFDFRSGHYLFTKMNGSFIGKLCLFNEVFRMAEAKILPKDFITRTFQHCPNIQRLRMQGWTLEKFTTGRAKKRSLKILELSHCQIGTGALELISSVLLEVKHLQIGSNTFKAGEGDNTSAANEIIMLPHTKVDLVTLENDYINSSRQVQCYSVTDKEHRYFQLDRYKIYAIPSSKENYMRAQKSARVEIHSQTFPLVRNLPNDAF